MKLRKLRALRGQPNPGGSNANPNATSGGSSHHPASVTADLESIRTLFNEKEKELSMAVQKVSLQDRRSVLVTEPFVIFAKTHYLKLGFTQNSHKISSFSYSVSIFGG